MVLLSSFSAGDLSDSPVSAEFRRIEDAVRAHEFEWTILRPQGFASTMPSLGWLPMFREGVVRAPFAATAVPVIHPADIASVAFTALTEDGHHAKTYELTGPEALTLPEQVRQIGEAIGRDLAFEELPVEQATPGAGRIRPGHGRGLLPRRVGRGPARRAHHGRGRHGPAATDLSAMGTGERRRVPLRPTATGRRVEGHCVPWATKP
ncbi:SDR family oxidoreductase [Phytoactinopolyspora endophytica]|uniref:SDR family oxidoreductase n=1 Tax=Phytoactinopolyspora endophytica TaxID=1642495 RepID=UPI0013EBFD63|nr:hypothetical protein [Phytoactinopolyspora endophytica]